MAKIKCPASMFNKEKKREEEHKNRSKKTNEVDVDAMDVQNKCGREEEVVIEEPTATTNQASNGIATDEEDDGDEEEEIEEDNDEGQKHQEEKDTLKGAVDTAEAIQDDNTNLIRVGFNKVAQKISGNENTNIYGPDQALQNGIGKVCAKAIEKTGQVLEQPQEDDDEEEDANNNNNNNTKNNKVKKAVAGVIHVGATGIAKRLEKGANLQDSTPQKAATNAIHTLADKVMQKSEEMDDKNKLQTLVSKGAQGVTSNIQQGKDIGLNNLVEKGVHIALDKTEEKVAQEGNQLEQGVNKGLRTITSNVEAGNTIALSTGAQRAAKVVAEKAADKVLDKRDNEKESRDTSDKENPKIRNSVEC